jgi:hypothetical protein
LSLAWIFEGLEVLIFEEHPFKLKYLPQMALFFELFLNQFGVMT